jgi:hypothetical protein
MAMEKENGLFVFERCCQMDLNDSFSIAKL